MDIQKAEITLNVNGRTARSYAAVPEGGGPGVLVLHAWWGLTPFFEGVCDRLAAEGFIALAPDLYEGRTAASVEEAKGLLGQRDTDHMIGVVEEAVNRLAALTDGNLAALGFSMGAAWSLVTAANEAAIKAVVLFYGAEGVEFKDVRARVLGHFAEVDEWEPMEGVKMMESDMRLAGLDVTLHIYPGVHHWFMETDRPEYDPQAAETAWQRTVAFLRETLA